VTLCLCSCWVRDAVHGYSTMSSILLYSSFFTVVVGVLTLIILLNVSIAAVLFLSFLLVVCQRVRSISRINQILVECDLKKNH
jgi:hypothetical protein